MNEERFTITQAATYLGVTRQTIRKMILRGQLLAVNDAVDTRQKLILKTDLDKLKAQTARSSGSNVLEQ